MPTLTESAMTGLLSPYLDPVPADLLGKLSLYLDLLLRWNAKTNLTAIRFPEEIVQRHFGESLFASRHLGPVPPKTLLDFGSGAGFPGLPIALLHPGIAVTLAESQNKKASFLREATRTLNLPNVEIWAKRAEDLPPQSLFHTVTLRAVDDMAVALPTAASRASDQLLLLATEIPPLPEGFTLQESISIPESRTGTLIRALRS